MTISYLCTAVSQILVFCDYPQVKVTDGERPVTTEDSVQTSI